MAAVARAECAGARPDPAIATLPAVWRAAVDDLVRSTTEPGHPWSCSGGSISLELTANGAVMRIARQGERGTSRHVGAPGDVLPLGEALLAVPLSENGESSSMASGSSQPPTVTPVPIAPPAQVDEIEPRSAERSAAADTARSPRLILSAGMDARHVGGPDVAWVGPSIRAAVPMGRLLPSISLRHQSTYLAHRPPLDEFSVAIAVQARFPISPLELRAGPVIRGATVQQDRRRRRGDRSRLEGRVGAIASLAVPVLRWANLVVSVDADIVGLSRETSEPADGDDDPPATSFPTYTLGGSACFEVLL